MRAPVCAVCYKFVGGHEGGSVRFADFNPSGYVTPQWYLDEFEAAERENRDISPEAYAERNKCPCSFDGPEGLYCFCNEHLSAAQALSSLPSQEALAELTKQFGEFQLPEPPKPTWWQRLLLRI